MAKSVTEEGLLTYQGIWWKLALPQVVLAAHLFVAGTACELAARRTFWNPGVVSAGLLAGWVLWTLFEYVLHRWFLHHTRHPLLRRLFWDGFHKEHHSYRVMKDPDHHGVHPAITLPLALLVVAASSLFSSGGIGLAVASGWLFGYCCYEALHWMFHTASPDGRILRFAPIQRLWRAHVVHHLIHGGCNYGFISLFWDREFGTAFVPSAESVAPSGAPPLGATTPYRDRDNLDA